MLQNKFQNYCTFLPPSVVTSNLLARVLGEPVLNKDRTPLYSDAGSPRLCVNPLVRKTWRMSFAFLQNRTVKSSDTEA